LRLPWATYGPNWSDLEMNTIETAGYRMMQAGVTSYISLNALTGARPGYKKGIFANRYAQREGRMKSPRIFTTGSLFTTHKSHTWGNTANIIDNAKDPYKFAKRYIDVYQPDLIIMNHRASRKAGHSVEEIEGMLIAGSGLALDDSGNYIMPKNPNVIPVWSFVNTWEEVHKILTVAKNLRAKNPVFSTIKMGGFAYLPVSFEYYKEAAKKDFDIAAVDVDETIEMIKDEGAVVTSGLVSYLLPSYIADNLNDFASDSYTQKFLSPALLKTYTDTPLKDWDMGNYGPAMHAQGKGQSEMQKTLVKLIKEGVPVLMGSGEALTGVPRGISSVFEMEMWAQAGLNNWQVLQGATTVPSNYFASGINDSQKELFKVGKFAKGYFADFLVFPEDKSPVDNISNIRDLSATWMSGEKVEITAEKLDLDMTIDKNN
ncbi:MAG: hypothetical protein AAF203_02395, partial [Pseudomonadota bacterium]